MRLSLKVGLIIIAIFIIFAIIQFFIYIKFFHIPKTITPISQNKDVLLYQKYLDEFTTRIDAEIQNLCSTAELNATKFIRDMYLNKISSIAKELTIFYNRNSPNFAHTFLFNKHGRLIAGKPFTEDLINEIYSYTHYYQYLLANTLKTKKAVVYYYLNDPIIIKKSKGYISKSTDASQPPFMFSKDFEDSETSHNFLDTKKIFSPTSSQTTRNLKFPLIVIGAPIFYGKKFLGITGFTVKYEDFLKKVKEGLLSEINLYIINKNGFIVECPDRYYVGENIAQNEIISRIQKGEEDYIFDSSGLFVYSKPKLCDWIAVGYIKTSPGTLKPLKPKVILAPFFILLLFEASLLLLLFLLLQKFIFIPVKMLDSTSRALATGNYSVILNWHSDDELGDIAKNLNHFISASKKVGHLDNLASRTVSKNIINKYLSDPSLLSLAGARMEGSVLFLRIKNISQIAEKLSSVEMIAGLSKFYEILENIIIKHNGYFVRPYGNSLFTYFGVPFKDENYAKNAINCAEEILLESPGIKLSGNQKFIISIGICSGTLYSGQITTENGKEFIITGNPVVLAQQLESFARENVALIDEATYRKEKVRIEKVLKLKVRDLPKPITVYAFKKGV